MGDGTSTQPGGGWLPRAGDGAARAPRLGLVLAWSSTEPARTGELALLPASGACLVGRGAPRDDDPAPRLRFDQQRPGGRRDPMWLGNPGLSRNQLILRPDGEQISVERVGRIPTRVRGVAIERAQLEPGDAIVVERELVLFCVAVDPNVLGGNAPAEFPFGEGGELALVGESARMWALRDELDFYARRDGHVLVKGPSGAGKELCARAIHARSTRARKPFVARNAATLPAGLIDAELFGNAKNYPNAGMRERLGMIGEADGGTLFLDEIGELPESLQAHLLRVLDAGEYHRLGEDRVRRADVRLIAATNRDEATLKHDLLARLTLRVDVPGFEERREDIPLLIRSILLRIAQGDADVKARFLDSAGEPRIDPELVTALLDHQFTTHMRELQSLLVLAMAGSKNNFLALTPAVTKRLVPMEQKRPLPTAAEIEAALARMNGNVSRAYKELGLASRDVLNRLLKKHNIVPRRD